MLIADTIFETKTAILANKVRSGLTILGIVIGIASVITMISIGRGAQKDIEEQIQSIGSNLLMIRPGAQFGPGERVSQGQGSATTLSMEDLEKIDNEIEAVELIAPVASRNYQVIFSGNNTRTSINGVTENYPAVKNIEMQEGSFLTEEQNKKMSKVAVIGPDIKEELFGIEEQSLGKKIKINGIDFTVVGETVSKGGSGMNSEDDVIYIPLKTFQQYLQGDDNLSLVNLKITDQLQMANAEAEIEQLLLNQHGISDPEEADFRIMNQADIIEMASSVTGTFTILLGAVASISLIVGGIGIMNMMLTSVTERTREIGLRKAIGAQKKDILRQFLFEAVVLTFVGGFIGVILGCAAALVIDKFFSISASIASYSIFLAFGVSALIGIVFGYYPARRAAKLNPIEALRYE